MRCITTSCTLQVPGIGWASNSSRVSPAIAWAGKSPSASYRSIRVRSTVVSVRLRVGELFVGVVPERLPVLARHRVLAGPDEVPEPAVDQLAERREVLGLQPAGAEQVVRGFGRLEDEELALRVRPQVF